MKSREEKSEVAFLHFHFIHFLLQFYYAFEFWQPTSFSSDSETVSHQILLMLISILYSSTKGVTYSLQFYALLRNSTVLVLFSNLTIDIHAFLYFTVSFLASVIVLTSLNGIIITRTSRNFYCINSRVIAISKFCT